jgi:hypothetical protein
VIRYITLALGLVIVAVGLLGLASPASYVDLIAFVSSRPHVLLLIVVRFGISGLFFASASEARWPLVMRVLGAMMLLFAVATLFSPRPLAALLQLDDPSTYVRPWSVLAVLVGSTVVAALVPPREFSD